MKSLKYNIIVLLNLQEFYKDIEMVGEKVAEDERDFEDRKTICLQFIVDVQRMYFKAINNFGDSAEESIDKLAIQQEALKIGQVANIVLSTRFPDEDN